MKSISTLFLFTMIALSGSAQITLESTDMTSIGDQILRYVDTIPAYGPGGDGSNQTWDFSAAVNDTLNNTDVVTVASTPYAGTFGSSDYAMTNDGAAYLYFNHNANLLSTTGAAGDLLGTGEIIEAPFSDHLILHEFPRTYMSTFDDTYEFEAEADGSAFGVYRIRVHHTGHVYDTTDGYGTLITPTGSYDALRVKSVDFTTDDIDVKLFSFTPWSDFTETMDTSVSYSWHAKEEMLAIAEFSYDSLGNPARFVYSTVPPVVPTGITQNQGDDFSIYPQPATDQLCLNRNSADPINYEIFSLQGQLLRSMRTNENCFEVGDLKSGFYLLRIKNDKGIIEENLRFVVQR